jgi:S-DNA-T family DNA segregation ATPase FtsK/SpoIIIE
MNKKRRNSSKNYSREAISVILIGLGIILLLAILSYDRTDNPNLNISDNSIGIKNWLGPLGAAIADPLMDYTLGYPIVILPLLIILFAVQSYRYKSFINLLRPAALLLVWAVVVSLILAMPEALETQGAIREYFPSGLLGGVLAAYFVKYLGKFGSILFLVIILLSLAVLSLRLKLDAVFQTVSKVIKLYYSQIKHDFNTWQKRRQLKKKEKLRQRLLHKKPVEIKTSSQEEISQVVEAVNEINSVGNIEKPAHVDVNAGKGPLGSQKLAPEMPVSKYEPLTMEDLPSVEEKMDFEVEQEAEVEQVDYDRMVRESLARYEFPSIDLLDEPQLEDTKVSNEELKGNAALIEAKLLDFGVSTRVMRVTAGPVITLYEVQPAPGVKVSQIVGLANDLALAMEARGIRMLAPIPGKAAIGIEIPNRSPQIVQLKSLIRSETYAKSDYILPLAIGKTINGEVYCADLTKMPHLLMAGSTGSGKSVGINTIIASILYKIDPGKVKFVLIDPKKIELSLYRDLSEHYLAWRPDLDEEVITKPSNAVSILNTIVLEMEKRYDYLAHLGVRNIEDYNMRVRQGGPRIKEEKLQQLPYIIVIIDELADLMLVAAKEVENPIARLTQMARAVGIHLILATQRPSVDVLTGVIKANFPARIAYMVTTRPDSKVILDMNGAEQLLGNGDMLYQPPGEPRPIRLQNPLITTEEVERIIRHIRKQPKLPHYSLPQPSESKVSAIEGLNGSGADELYEEAKRIVVQHQQGSISLLQRRLKIGYSRAARLIDDMEDEGIVGPADGSKPRQVFYLPEDL